MRLLKRKCTDVTHQSLLLGSTILRVHMNVNEKMMNESYRKRMHRTKKDNKVSLTGLQDCIVNL